MHDFKNNIIVSADDFGIRNVAEPILSLARQGKIDRVSVLINYVTSKEQAEELLATGVKIDLHLELIQLIRSGERVEGSALLRGMNFAIRSAFGLVRVSEVERLWIDQIKAFKKMFGRYPDGLNSHEHLHYFPKFFRIALSLSERYHIPFVRFARKGIIGQKTSMVFRILSFLWKKDSAYYDAQQQLIDTTDFFVSYDWIDDFDNFLKYAPLGVTEIVFHPERQCEYDAIDKYF